MEIKPHPEKPSKALVTIEDDLERRVLYASFSPHKLGEYILLVTLDNKLIHNLGTERDEYPFEVTMSDRQVNRVRKRLREQTRPAE